MTNTITSEDIKKLAQLARLTVPEAELESLQKDITNILGFIDRIQAVQLDEVATINEQEHNVFRDDAVQPLQSAHDLIEAAPLHQDHFVKVPKVIE